MTLEARHLGVTIAVSFDRAYAFASRPENFPKWAAGLATSLHRRDGEWLADTPEGEARVLFTEPNRFGVLDHHVILAGRPPIDIPLRMIANGEGTEVVFTLYRQPGMDEAAFERDAGLVTADLASLKALLEGG